MDERERLYQEIRAFLSARETELENPDVDLGDLQHTVGRYVEEIGKSNSQIVDEWYKRITQLTHKGFISDVAQFRLVLHDFFTELLSELLRNESYLTAQGLDAERRRQLLEEYETRQNERLEIKKRSASWKEEFRNQINKYNSLVAQRLGAEFGAPPTHLMPLAARITHVVGTDKRRSKSRGAKLSPPEKLAQDLLMTPSRGERISEEGADKKKPSGPERLAEKLLRAPNLLSSFGLKPASSGQIIRLIQFTQALEALEQTPTLEQLDEVAAIAARLEMDGYSFLSGRMNVSAVALALFDYKEVYQELVAKELTKVSKSPQILNKLNTEFRDRLARLGIVVGALEMEYMAKKFILGEKLPVIAVYQRIAQREYLKTMPPVSPGNFFTRVYDQAKSALSFLPIAGFASLPFMGSVSQGMDSGIRGLLGAPSRFTQNLAWQPFSFSFAKRLAELKKKISLITILAVIGLIVFMFGTAMRVADQLKELSEAEGGLGFGGGGMLASGSCPLAGSPVISNGIYNPGLNRGHGSNYYWDVIYKCDLNGDGVRDRYCFPLPDRRLKNNPACTTPNTTDCEDEYGLAIDVDPLVGAGARVDVRVPFVCKAGEVCDFSKPLEWIVVNIGRYGETGNSVVLETTDANGHKWKILLLHLAPVTYNEGTTFTTDSGNNVVSQLYDWAFPDGSDNTHLHFEITLDGVAIDPTPFCDGRGGAPRAPSCTVPADIGNYCHPDNPISNIRGVFGNVAEEAAMICTSESIGGDTTAINNGCVVGRSAEYSIGPYQINVLVHTPPELKAMLPNNKVCADAFTDWDGTISDKSCTKKTDDESKQILATCEQYFMTPNYNVLYAKKLYDASAGDGDGWRDDWTNSANNCKL